jgi:hypothetical protein
MARGGVIRPSQILGRNSTCGSNATEKRSREQCWASLRPTPSRSACGRAIWLDSRSCRPRDGGAFVERRQFRQGNAILLVQRLKIAPLKRRTGAAGARNRAARAEEARKVPASKHGCASCARVQEGPASIRSTRPKHSRTPPPSPPPWRTDCCWLRSGQRHRGEAPAAYPRFRQRSPLRCQAPSALRGSSGSFTGAGCRRRPPMGASTSAERLP